MFVHPVNLMAQHMVTADDECATRCCVTVVTHLRAQPLDLILHATGILNEMTDNWISDLCTFTWVEHFTWKLAVSGTIVKENRNTNLPGVQV